MNDPEEEKVFAIRPNKTQLKKAIAERQQTIDLMTGLTDKELAKLGLDEDTIDEIDKVRSIRPSGARNRQIKYCHKKLQNVDFEEVEKYLSNRHSQQLEVNQKFHLLEVWRDRLIAEGDKVLGEALEKWPDIDRQHIRQLIRDSQRENDKGKPVGAKKKLFKYLRGLGTAED